jgi:molybdopterin converting factor subunit 1
MRVLLFARARDLAGMDVLDVAVPAGATVGDLRRCLRERCPRLGSLLERSAIAVNNEYAEDATPLPANAEVALVPPVSGGTMLIAR